MDQPVGWPQAQPSPEQVADPAPQEPGLFSVDDLQRISDEMVMGDVWRASKSLGPSATKGEIGMGAFHVAAMRLGLMPRGTDVADFLDRVRQDDFVRVNKRVDVDVPKEPQP